jgi:predicted transcriptional regulator
MLTKKTAEKLPCPAEEMDGGEWADPRPMRTTSLRLPGEVVTALKELAQARGVRYTALVREMLEKGLREATKPDSGELDEINARLARIERAVAGKKRASARTGLAHRRLPGKKAH